MALSFDHITARLAAPIQDLPEHQYEYYVNLTAKLISRPYMLTAKLVEKWPPDKIIRRYNDASKCANPAMRWWVLRKLELTQ